jgi:hypothetical protein
VQRSVLRDNEPKNGCAQCTGAHARQKTTSQCFVIPNHGVYIYLNIGIISNKLSKHISLNIQYVKCNYIIGLNLMGSLAVCFPKKLCGLNLN